MVVVCLAMVVACGGLPFRESGLPLSLVRVY